MMVLESSFIPFPSEVAMIPAWYLASIWKMNFSLALLVWTSGALIWATINYLLWYYLGWKIIKKLIKKYWKYIFIKESHYKKSEEYFKEHWIITTFLARFITVVRQLISLPAWVFKINFAKFFFYTGLWAGLWNLALMTIWYIAWENQDMIAKYSKELLFWWLFLIFLIWYIYYLIKNLIYENASIWISVNSKNEILLQKRTDLAKLWEKWASFWWNIKENETHLEALKRRIKEELNFDLKKSETKFLTTHTFFYFKYKKITRINYFISFLDIDLNNLNLEKNNKAKYFSLKELNKINFVIKWDNLRKFKNLIKAEIKNRK
jgi:membrane protein DedA with SNARE-associated domain